MHPGAYVVGQPRGGSLLDHLLVPTLKAAVTIAELDRLPMTVADHLHLDVPGPPDVALEDQGIVTERGRGLATC